MKSLRSVRSNQPKKKEGEMKSLKSARSILVVMLVVILLVSGCGPSPTAAPTAVPPTEAPTAVPPTEAPTAVPPTEAPTEAPTPEPVAAGPTGSLTVALSNLEAETFLPWNGGGGRTPYLELINEYLLYMDPATEELTPGLATSWEMSEDGMTWTFEIRQGIQFHEGWGELTAEDVKYSIERMIDPDSIAGPAGSMRKLIEKVEAPEPYKVVIYMITPFPELDRGYLCDANQMVIVSKKYLETVGDEEANAHPIGTGPYTLAEEHQKAGPVVLKTIEGVENHWRVTPEFETVTFLAVPEEATRVAMLLAGEVDLAPISYDSIDTIGAAPGLHVTSVPKNWSPLIRLGGIVDPAIDPERYNAENPWTDVKVRQAMNYAIDKEAIAENIFHGEAQPGGSSMPVPPFFDIEPYPYDPEKAKELLAEAGYADGFPITLKTFTTSPGAELPTIGEAVALYWQAIGLDVTIVPTDWGTVRGEWTGGQALDFVWTHRGLAFADPLTALNTDFGINPFTTYVTEETQDMLAQLGAEFDAQKREQLAWDMAQLVRDQASGVFLVFANEPYGASEQVGYWPTIRTRPQNIDQITTEAPPVAPAAAPTEAPTPKPAAAEPTGNLTVALSSFAEDTFLPWNGGVARQTYLGLIYEFLAYADPETAEPQPGLATSWEMSEDGKTWTFELRQGVQFHEGWGELTAEDVKFSWERMVDENSIGSPAGQLRALFDTIEVVDPYKIVVTLQNPYAELVRSFMMDYNAGGMIVCKKYVESVGDEEANAHPIGTGPYTLAEEHQQAGPIVLKTIEGVENHWRVTPEFETVTFLLVPEEATRVAMLKAGEVDLAPISYDSVETIKESGLHIVSIPQSWVPLIWFGGMVETQPERYVAENPWADVRVRQALNYAVDREAIAESIFHGEATPAGSSNPIPGWIDIEPYPYDPDKAKELLAEAGYPDGFPLTLKTLTMNPGAELPVIGEAVALYWQAIGIDVKVAPTDWGSVRDELLGGKANDYLFTQRGQPFAEALTPATIFYAPQGKFTSYATEESAALLDQMLTELDAGKREQLAREFGQLLQDDAAAVFIAYANEPYGASDQVGQWPTIRMRPFNIELITRP
jgi:ABC-type transport system substrate-binding protein